QEQFSFLLCDWHNQKFSGSDQAVRQSLQRKIGARQRGANLGSRFLRIDRRQRLSAIIDFWKNTAARLNLTTKKSQIFFGHEWHVDSKCQQVFGVHPRQGCRKPTERSA